MASNDIVFHGPRFSGDGKLLRPARVTVLHNGLLVQDNVEILGPTATDAGRVAKLVAWVWRKSLLTLA